MGSCNAKTVFTAAVIIFNHVLTFKGDLSSINNQLLPLLMTSIEVLSNAMTQKGVNDEEAVMALLLAEIRMLYKNDAMTKKVGTEMKDKFLQVHQ